MRTWPLCIWIAAVALSASGCASGRPGGAEGGAAAPAPVVTEMTGRGKGARWRYDPVYEAGEKFSQEPNARLMSWVRRVYPDGGKGARVLDAGMGQGRNAVALAREGFAVSGFDASGVGVEMARRAAASAGVTIDAVVADGELYDYGVDRWDVVVLMYYLPSLETLPRLKESVKPGGHIVLELLGRDPLGKDRPVANAILGRFTDLEIVYYEQLSVPRSDWHWGTTADHQTIVRLIARRPW